MSRRQACGIDTSMRYRTMYVLEGFVLGYVHIWWRLCVKEAWLCGRVRDFGVVSSRGSRG